MNNLNSFVKYTLIVCALLDLFFVKSDLAIVLIAVALFMKKEHVFFWLIAASQILN